MLERQMMPYDRLQNQDQDTAVAKTPSPKPTHQTPTHMQP